MQKLFKEARKTIAHTTEIVEKVVEEVSDSSENSVEGPALENNTIIRGMGSLMGINIADEVQKFT